MIEYVMKIALDVNGARIYRQRKVDRFSGFFGYGGLIDFIEQIYRIVAYSGGKIVWIKVIRRETTPPLSLEFWQVSATLKGGIKSKKLMMQLKDGKLEFDETPFKEVSMGYHVAEINGREVALLYINGESYYNWEHRTMAVFFIALSYLFGPEGIPIPIPVWGKREVREILEGSGYQRRWAERVSERLSRIRKELRGATYGLQPVD